MNIALGALIIFILLLPGIIFRFQLIKSDSTENIIDTSFTSEVVYVVLASILLHCIATIFLYYCCSTIIRFDQLYYVLIGSDGEGLDLNFLRIRVLPFIYYTLIISILAGIIGLLLKMAIIKWYWDENIQFLKITNEWDDVFTGRLKKLKLEEDFDWVHVDVVVNIGSDTYIYCGFLIRYFLARNNNLDKIYLANVSRRKIDRDEERVSDQSEIVDKVSDPRYYNLPGDYFILSANQIENINVMYLKAEHEECSE